jgi:hypothetical protein
MRAQPLELSQALTGCASEVVSDKPMRRPPLPAWIAPALAIVGGCGLLGAMFLDWYAGLGIEGAYFNRSVGAPAYAGVFSAWGSGDNAWEAFAGLDIALAAFAVLALFLGVAGLRSSAPKLRARASAATFLAGLGVAGWTLERIFDRPELVGLGPGAVLGFAAVVVALGGAALTSPRTSA